VVLSLSACIAIENLTALTLTWSSTGTYRIEVRVESYASEVLAVRAEIDGSSVSMTHGSGSTWYTDVTRTRCTRGLSVRYLVDYRTSSEAPTQTRSEPAAGVFPVRITGVPADCPAGTQRELLVNATTDSVDATPGDGVCADTAGRCTLRAAIMESNASAGTQLVRVPAGTVTLSLTSGSNRFGIAITDNVTIRGVERSRGLSPTSIVTVDPAAGATSGGFGFPVFRIAPTGSTSISVHMADLTLRNGFGLYGGAVDNRAALLVQRCLVEGSTHAAQGGGFWNTGTLTLEHTTVRDNAAVDGGGIFNSGTVIVRQSTLSGNSASDEGGALHAWFGLVDLVNSTISGNVARQGGGLSLLYPVVTALRHTTFSTNRTTAGAGGAIHADLNASVLIAHSIVAGNAATPNETADARATLGSLGHNLIGVCTTSGLASCRLTGGTTTDLFGSASTPLDAVLLDLADNGGLTRSHLPHDSSPAVDAGNSDEPANDANALACAQKDQRGGARPAEGACELGAVER